ncbi:MAG: HAMP domain-containing histidine kinase [Ignavibacterium sp.]|nr:HAMP domain-containing histidine kinase [Ignavibacterium sp.]MDW8374279.1 HAMP domain-containing sensor histidine kinase [Ignavibacteriales bacterium]
MTLKNCSFNRNFLNVNIFTPTQKRIFITVLFMSVIVSLVGILLNIILGLNEYLTFFYLIAFTFSLVLFFLARKESPELISKYYYIYWFGLMIILPIVWIYGGGIDGSWPILFVAIYIGLFLTTNEKREYILLISVLFAIILILLDYLYPEIIVRFDERTQRITYFIKAFVVYLILIHYLLEFILFQNKIEHRKLELTNKNLSETIQKNKILNEKLDSLLKELQNANNSKDRFISIVAHDLRSPYQGLLGVTRLLKENYTALSEEEKKQLIDKLNALVEKQYSFLEELLIWGRLQKNNISIKIEEFSIKDVLLSIIENFNFKIESKNLDVQLLLDDNLVLKSDRYLISTVLRNVLSNAIKFSNHNGKVEITGRKKENYYEVKIKDYGIGIDNEDLNNLFLIDTKVTKKGTDGETGFGFGLVVSNEIMSKLNGTISIESQEGIGTSVTILIPNKVD